MIPRPTRRRIDAFAAPMMERANRALWNGRNGLIDGRPVGLREFFAWSVSSFPETGTHVMISRDVGHHTSGWLKNPEYERCWHLSLSPSKLTVETSRILTPDRALVGPDLQPLVGAPRAHRSIDRDLETVWVEAFFGKRDARLVWRESAKSRAGREVEVWHYRVFCDSAWMPLKHVRYELYSTELTARGWKSWSELHPENPRAEGVSTVDPS